MVDKINKLVRNVTIPHLTSDSNGTIPSELPEDTIVVRAVFGNYMLFPYTSSGKLKYVVGDITSDLAFKAVPGVTQSLELAILER